MSKEKKGPTPYGMSTSKSCKSSDGGTGKAPYKQGVLWKYRAEHSQGQAPFERKNCSIDSVELRVEAQGYHWQKMQNECLPIRNITLVENLDGCEYFKKNKRQFCFQVGNKEDRMYFCAQTEQDRDEWKEECRKAASLNNNKMERLYHTGVFNVDEGHRNRWSCCKQKYEDRGCEKSTLYPQEDDEYKPPKQSECSRTDSDSKASTAQGGKKQESEWLEMKVSAHPISSLNLLADNVTVVYVTGSASNEICIYNTSERKLLHKMRFKCSLSDLDVYGDRNTYILASSSIIQLLEMNTDGVRRIVVMDAEDEQDFESAPVQLCNFTATGCFVTASTTRNVVLFWPKPQENMDLMTETNQRIPLGNDLDQICSMSTWASLEIDSLAVARRSPDRSVHVDVMKCISPSQPWSVQRTIVLGVSEFLHSAFGANNLYFTLLHQIRVYERTNENIPPQTVQCTNKIRAVAKSHDGLCVMFTDGSIVLYKGTIPKPLQKLEVESAVKVIAYNGPLTVGCEDGKIHIWRDKPEARACITNDESCNNEEINALTMDILLGDTFHRKSLLCDEYSFDVDAKGGKYLNYPSYSLDIPPYAVPKYEKLKIKTGMLKYGSFGLFQYPENCTVVTPIVWFTSNEPDRQFCKPLTLKMQHCYRGNRSLILLKAILKSENDESTQFYFKRLQTIQSVQTNEECQPYAIAEINHFCVYCAALPDFSDDEPEFYCRIFPIERIGYVDKTHEIIFCVTYYLEGCKKAVEKQYASNYKIKKPLKILVGRSQSVKIEHKRQTKVGWTITLTYPGFSQISLTELNWSLRFKNPKHLLAAHSNKEYPPRFILEICGKEVCEQKSDVTDITFKSLSGLIIYRLNLWAQSLEECGISVEPWDNHTTPKLKYDDLSPPPMSPQTKMFSANVE